MLSFALIAGLLLLQFGIKAGLAGIIANLLPLVATTGLICWLGIPFDFATILVTGITLGLAVDDSIHFLHGYQRQEDQGSLATQRTLTVVGAPIMAVGILFCLGLAVLTQSDLVVLVRFGFFTLFGISLSVLATAVFLPALLGLIDDRVARAPTQPGQPAPAS